jgi:putative FmdB family regulatory protein
MPLGGYVPTYQYACTECGDKLEVVQRFSDDPLTVCAACGGKLRKVFSPVGIVFKGSGFYRTDSRSGSVASASANGDGKSGSEGSSDGSSSSSTDSASKSEAGAKSESSSSAGSSTSSNGSSAGTSGSSKTDTSSSSSKVA